GILSSTEFANRASTLATGATSDEQFVRALYQTLLVRKPSDQEVARWVAALPTVGRKGVADAFLNSQEFRTTFTTPLSTVVLDRNSDGGGMRSWVNPGMDLAGIREGFFGSLEFFQ